MKKIYDLGSLKPNISDELQITLPKDVARSMGIDSSSYIEAFIDNHCFLVFKKAD